MQKQGLFVGKETGNNPDYKLATQPSHQTPSSLKIQIKVWPTAPRCFCRKQTPDQRKTAGNRHVQPGPPEARRLAGDA